MSTFSRTRQPNYSGACIICHGQASGYNDLTGGVTWTNIAGESKTPPSCYTCHIKRWLDETDDSTYRTAISDYAFNPTSDHLIGRRGRMHRPLSKQGALTGTDNALDPWGGLRGSNNTPLNNYPALKVVSGDAPVGKPGFGYCAACHSSGDNNQDLLGNSTNPVTGTTPPSCFTCHGERWTGGNTGDLSVKMCSGGTGHTVNMRGYMHRSIYDKPLLSPGQGGGMCYVCHSTDTTDTSTHLLGTLSHPSCYTCHGAEWLY